MIDKELLEILACPETHQTLSLAPQDLLQRVNAAIQAGQQKNRAGQAVAQAIEAGLLRADQRVLYPVRDGIPVLLIDEGLPLAG